jgi:hypothetical protein
MRHQHNVGNHHFSLLSPLFFLFLIAYTLGLTFSSKIVFAGEGQLTLTWNPNVESDLAGYRIYYGTSSKIYEATVDVGDNTSWVLTGLEEGLIYYCAATAYDMDGNESEFSEEVSGLVPITDTDEDGMPANNSGQLTLTWNPNNESDLAGYKIYYGKSSRIYEEWIDVGNNTNCVLTGLEEGLIYYCAATAYDMDGNESEFSEEVSGLVSITDTDGDGLWDNDEINLYGTDPYLPDTDADGIEDLEELAYWGDNWAVDFDGDGIHNLLDADSDGDGYSDGFEIAQGYDPADPTSTIQFPNMETGEVSVDNNWMRVEFTDFFVDPIVVSNPLSSNEEDPAVIRIRDVDSTGFDIRIQEWDYLDGTHTTEKVGYIVMERGSYTLEDGTKLEAGSFDSDSISYFGWINFAQAFNQVPVVVSAVVSFNEEDAVCCRLKNINTTGFDFSMQEQELNSQSHCTETISYIAWEPSSGAVDNLVFEVDRTQDVINEDFRNISFNQTLMDVPVFIADMQTAEGSDTANIRWDIKDIYGVDVKLSEEQSMDSETKHTAEVIGYMVFSALDIDINMDTDGDGLLDGDEINIYGTDPANHDTDGDNINDGDEVDYWGDNWSVDFDEDGLHCLLDWDSDGDGSSDADEINTGYDPSDPAVFPSTGYEDAEDGTTSRWSIYDNTPEGAQIINIFDDDRQSYVIQVMGTGIDNCYSLRNSDGSQWQNSNQFVVEWSMKYSERFVVYLDVETTAGHRYIYYTEAGNRWLGEGEYVHHGLGAYSIDGHWHTFVRDLQADLEDAQSGVTILEVNGFLIRGSGCVDDILLK